MVVIVVCGERRAFPETHLVNLSRGEASDDHQSGVYFSEGDVPIWSLDGLSI
jgi:hypothetical protein